MKKISLLLCALVAFNSCSIKEEYTLSKTGSVDYNYSVNGKDLVDFMGDETGFKDVLSEKKELVAVMEKGMTIETFYSYLKNEKDLLKEKQRFALDYFKENQAVYNQIKQHTIKVDLKNLSYTTELKSTTKKISQESQQLNDFLFNLFNEIDSPFKTNYLANSKTITNNSFEIKFNQAEYTKMIQSISKEFDAKMGENKIFKKMFSYQLIIHTPNKIIESSENGSFYSLDQKTMKLNYTFDDIISAKNKSVKITF